MQHFMLILKYNCLPILVVFSKRLLAVVLLWSLAALAVYIQFGFPLDMAFAVAFAFLAIVYFLFMVVHLFLWLIWSA